MNNMIGAIILGAGKGTRMKSDLPKVLMPVDGKPMIRHIIDTLEKLKIDKIVTVIAPDGDAVKKEVSPYPTCVQEKQLGTGHAVLAARDEFRGFTGDVLVIFGDQPLYTQESMKKLLRKRRQGYSVVCMGFRPQDPARYGRLIMEGDNLKRIVEFKDATDEEKAITFCNSGIMCFDGEKLFSLREKKTISTDSMTNGKHIAAGLHMHAKTQQTIPDTPGKKRAAPSAVPSRYLIRQKRTHDNRPKRTKNVQRRSFRPALHATDSTRCGCTAHKTEINAQTATAAVPTENPPPDFFPPNARTIESKKANTSKAFNEWIKTFPAWNAPAVPLNNETSNM